MEEEKPKIEPLWVPFAKGIGIVLILIAIGTIILGFGFSGSKGLGEYWADSIRFYLFLFVEAPLFVIGIILLLIVSLRRKK
jgi:predicted acetyltransferase